MKHIVCYSGGHSSAIVAIEVARKFNSDDVILLNHDISANVEQSDVKRFKSAIAANLGIEIEYANHRDYKTKDQLDICAELGSFINSNTRQELCTTKMKTEPFKKWLLEYYKTGDRIYYGFDKNELHRVQRRIGIMDAGFLHDSKKEGIKYKTEYPIAFWKDRTIESTLEIDVNPPCQYASFKHANCIACLKAGWMHWYIVYCQRNDLFEKAKEVEKYIGYSIHNDCFLKDKELLFEDMKNAGVPQTEHIEHNRFWAQARKAVANSKAGQRDLFGMEIENQKPCECTI